MVRDKLRGWRHYLSFDVELFALRLIGWANGYGAFCYCTSDEDEDGSCIVHVGYEARK